MDHNWPSPAIGVSTMMVDCCKAHQVGLDFGGKKGSTITLQLGSPGRAHILNWIRSLDHLDPAHVLR